MPRFMIDPMPEMRCQSFVKGTFLIDPTCGRYCLKSLLKYWFEKDLGLRPKGIELPKPESTLKDWVAFDPHDDFKYGEEWLIEDNAKPMSMIGWINKLQQFGPIILGGVLGEARRVSHYILLVGARSEGEDEVFSYKDPLVGDEIREEAFITMQRRIQTPLVYAQHDIGKKIMEKTKFTETGLRTVMEKLQRDSQAQGSGVHQASGVGLGL